jgi:hypothetical protein
MLGRYTTGLHSAMENYGFFVINFNVASGSVLLFLGFSDAVAFLANRVPLVAAP